MSTINAGDTGFMMASTALVFLMTPGLSLFYSGLVHRRNAINTLLMSFIPIGIVGVEWILFGFSFAFGQGSRGFGGWKWGGFKDVGENINTDYAPTIPFVIYALFQMTFAIITPALIAGSVVGRMKWKQYVLFIVVWSIVVYNLIAHWVWGYNTLEDGTKEIGIIKDMTGDGHGAIDFAGGCVVHISSGISALVASIIVGRRRAVQMKNVPHNIPFVILGASLLWFGWFGFNAGSALTAGKEATVAFANTQIAACAAFLSWMVLETIFDKKASACGAATGAVVGLVGITPSAGFVEVWASIPIGIITAAACYGAVKLKHKFTFDDTLDVFSCHGVGGIVGSILTGFFATSKVNVLVIDEGVFYGGGKLLGYQIAGVLITLVVCGGLTAALLLSIKYLFGGLIVEEKEEEQGLDQQYHGEESYSLETPAPQELRRRGASMPASPVPVALAAALEASEAKADVEAPVSSGSPAKPEAAQV